MHVWVIEMLDESAAWLPTASCGTSREHARREANEYWRENYPDDLFRVRKYVRV